MREVLKLVFEDELETANLTFEDQRQDILFNVFLHALAGSSSGVVNLYNWFQDRTGRGIPTDPNGIIVLALDNVLATLGSEPYDIERPLIFFTHPIYGDVEDMPFAQRSTYAQIVEMGGGGPNRIETMFALGQSGQNTPGEFEPVYDENFFSRQEFFELFSHSPAQR